MIVTSLNLLEILGIIIIHFIADFIMQDEKWALAKSKSIKDLMSHTTIYSIIWFIIGCWLLLFDIINNEKGVLLFVLITFILHTITDYFGSKIVSKRFNIEKLFTLHFNTSSVNFRKHDILYPSDNINNKVIVFDDKDKHNNTYTVKVYNPIPNFGAFTLIGFDQLLHYIQLFITYYILFK